ncbi:hypothetical protein LPJ66_001228 [Kickxella alabastrina]|uniref:Uncharacterized protein n=1 Tax=Kickxella alabastrina TaxID=61397 RepID=A0ACC1ITU6_9FUNG|nr:hypothetical protein LPJ66_001228 [Kickxella alabastrina]
MLLSQLRQQFGAALRMFSTARPAQRISDRFKMQFRLPGRTTSVLSSGVAPTPNDPMLARSRYFKPKGLSQGTPIGLLLGSDHRRYTYETSTPAFRLIASPWASNEHPRDHNALRLRDYRVTCMATKKQYSKKAYHRWRAVRVLRTAAAMVLPDKGLRRCDYVFVASAKMRTMQRDDVWRDVERALAAVRRRIEREWMSGRRVERPLLGAAIEMPRDPGKHKILRGGVDERAVPPDYCVSRIIEECK